MLFDKVCKELSLFAGAKGRAVIIMRVWVAVCQTNNSDFIIFSQWFKDTRSFKLVALAPLTDTVLMQFFFSDFKPNLPSVMLCHLPMQLR